MSKRETGRPCELASPARERHFRSNSHGGRDRAGQPRGVLSSRPSDQDRNRPRMDVDLKRFFSRHLEAHDRSGVAAEPIPVRALRALLSGLDEARPAPRIIRLDELVFLTDSSNEQIVCVFFPLSDN